MGHEAANLFKVSNDGAIFLQRLVLKTIETLDTSLLTHVKENKEDLQNAFKNLLKKIILLCTPIILLLLISSFLKKQILFKNFSYKLFFIMSLGYLI